MVLETTTVPQLNNLQYLEHCEFAIGLGQRAVY
jgi:hypothetical protein